MRRVPLGRELDAVGQQVRHDLLKTRRIAQCFGGLRFAIEDQRDALCRSRRTDGIDRGLEHWDQIDQRRLDPQLARGDARRVEQVFDDLNLRLRVALNDRDGAVDRIDVYSANPKQVRVAEDCAQGRPQLVGNQREEFVLRTARRFGDRSGRLLLGEFLTLCFGLLALGDVDARSDVAEKP
jgi:hypothetical protein